MQDKRAKKRMPLVGTKKYPVYWLGRGKVVEGFIIIDPIYATIPLIIEPKHWRFYESSEGKFLKGIKSVQFESMYF